MLDWLKRALGKGEEATPSDDELAPDLLAVLGGEERATEIAEACSLLRAFEGEVRSSRARPTLDTRELAGGPAIFESSRETQRDVLLLAVERADELIRLVDSRNQRISGKDLDWNCGSMLRALVENLLRRKLPFTPAQLRRLIDRRLTACRMSFPLWDTGLLKAAERVAGTDGLPEELRSSVEGLLSNWEQGYQAREVAKWITRTRVLLGQQDELAARIEAGEAWADRAIEDLERFKDARLSAWNALLHHAQAASGGKPTKKWATEADKLVKAVRWNQFRDTVIPWFELVEKPRTQPFRRRGRVADDIDLQLIPPHVDLLKGLVWCAGQREDPAFARALSRLALTSYKKIPGLGPRLVSLGNACVLSLGTMPGELALPQLSVLRARVKFGTAQKGIEKALARVAERLGVDETEIEEIGIPTLGLTEVGRLERELGEHVAVVEVEGSTGASLRWRNAGGKLLKSVPAAVKRDHATELKELRAQIKDLKAQLPAQRDRIDQGYLNDASWPLATWRERYLDHPLLGTLARRLIWTVEDGSRESSVLWSEGRLESISGQVLESDEGTVRLWHPVGREVDEVLAWRRRLVDLELTQPFKQAHREVYVLTDAERATRVYSNRFAAHLLKQHQFNALCSTRGWRNQLRLMVDDSYPPASRELPAHGLRAEFWVEGAGDEYGVDTNEAGTYLLVGTDQVRFYPIGTGQLHAHAGGGGYGSSPWQAHAPGEPLPLEEIPPLVLSEILRDVDLFVGVASVAADPVWMDGGREQSADYWHRTAFGELSTSAQSRREVLEMLIPRLKIADRCELRGRFLFVRGNIRSYKIHLGSGNIMMEPNDQYLCIVPQLSGEYFGGRVVLPFEGDRILSVILSKAFLLADDESIEDQTIVSQIGRR